MGAKAELPDRTVSQDEIQQFIAKDHLKYYEVSSKTDMNVFKLFSEAMESFCPVAVAKKESRCVIS